ncbi:hypothetical protein ACFPAF_17530 [Hymenobacter endophyticus]|uniref:Uncharacterized protein n=1 Tax=Hymenobacter endophyticus TaxID=3076335 RepID=A0ABU3TLF6_9BACT|nr:hypothetical protein [Hymenobacter endophyticus]MDU0372208.1 hypothetical protein [Hymenobacter endophyticus]
MAVSTSISTSGSRRRHRRLKSEKTPIVRNRKLVVGVLGLLLFALLASLGVIAANLS